LIYLSLRRKKIEKKIGGSPKSDRKESVPDKRRKDEMRQFRLFESLRKRRRHIRCLLLS
jgi:hypothetical protein